MKLVWSRDARADLSEIHAFFCDIDPAFAVNATELAVESAEFLIRHPSAGPVIPETKMRKWRVPRTRYILIYRVAAGRLRVLRVLHSAQNWHKFLD